MRVCQGFSALAEVRMIDVQLAPTTDWQLTVAKAELTAAKPRPAVVGLVVVMAAARVLTGWETAVRGWVVKV